MLQLFGTVCSCTQCMAIVEAQKSEEDKENEQAKLEAAEKAANRPNTSDGKAADNVDGKETQDDGNDDGEPQRVFDKHDGRPVPKDFVHYDDIEAKRELQPEFMDAATCRKLIYDLQCDDQESQVCSVGVLRSDNFTVCHYCERY